ncbi:MAG: hypothetical protein EBT15_09730, partial [Betaproteobacteria bacterium]|nr:hypothetical protein [Betaproteobacteria bacterium]
NFRDLNVSRFFILGPLKFSTNDNLFSRPGAKVEVDSCTCFDPLTSVVSTGVTGLECYSGALLSGGFASS